MEFMKTVCQAVFSVLLLFGLTYSAAGQLEELFPTRLQSEFADVAPRYCWDRMNRLSSIVQGVPADKTIIAIARLGDKDLKPNLNKRRLHNTRMFLTRGAGELFIREPQTLILAEGEPIKGYGQIEFYLDGRLIEILKVHPNSDFPVADCYAGIDGSPVCADKYEKLFYPCKDYIAKRKQKKKVAVRKKKARQSVRRRISR